MIYSEATYKWFIPRPPSISATENVHWERKERVDFGLVPSAISFFFGRAQLIRYAACAICCGPLETKNCQQPRFSKKWSAGWLEKKMAYFRSIRSATPHLQPTANFSGGSLVGTGLSYVQDCYLQKSSLFLPSFLPPVVLSFIGAWCFLGLQIFWFSENLFLTAILILAPSMAYQRISWSITAPSISFMGCTCAIYWSLCSSGIAKQNQCHLLTGTFHWNFTSSMPSILGDLPSWLVPVYFLAE